MIGYDRDNSIPIPSYIGMSQASTHDLQAFRHVEKELSNCELFGDSAYNDTALFSELSERNVLLKTPIKRKKGKRLSILLIVSIPQQ